MTKTILAFVGAFFIIGIIGATLTRPQVDVKTDCITTTVNNGEYICVKKDYSVVVLRSQK